MINKYIHVPYLNGGRDINVGLDCYGLLRLSHHEKHPTKKPLPMLDGLDADDKGDVTLVYRELHKEFQEVDVRDGAIACAFLDRVLMHVGLVLIVDGRMCVLETNKDTGVTTSSPEQFSAHYTGVKYYDY